MKRIWYFFPMCWAIIRGRYPMPWKTFFTALLCAVYVLSPVDLLPDMLPVLGVTDDLTFVLLVLAMLGKDIDQYRASLQTPAKPIIDLGDIKDHRK